MAIGRVEISVEASGSKRTAEAGGLAEGKKLQFVGTRLGFILPDNPADYTLEQLHTDVDKFIELMEITPHRFADRFDCESNNTRAGQDAGRLHLYDNHVPTQDEFDATFKERWQGTGRGGARGPRKANDQQVIKAVAALVKVNPEFQGLADYLNNTPVSKLAEAVAKVRADFSAAGVTDEQIKELASQA